MAVMKFNKVQGWLPIIHVAVLCIGTFTSFGISVNNGNVSPYLPFVSETGAHSPGQPIFSLSLIVGSFFGSILVVFMSVILDSIHKGEVKNFEYVNIAAAVIGLNAMFGLAGVAAFPMSTVFWLHLLLATVYFSCSALYFMIISYVTFKIEGPTFVTILRIVLTGFITILLIIMLIIFPIALKNWDSKHQTPPAKKEPTDEGFTLLIISSTLEWLIVGVIVSFYGTLYSEMKKVQLSLKTSDEEVSPNTFAEGSPTPEVVQS